MLKSTSRQLGRPVTMLTILAAVLVAQAVANPGQQLPADQPTAVCQVLITGDGKSTIKSASMHCTGGPAKVAVDERMLGPHKAHFQGVSWDKNCDGYGCLLTVCGGSHVAIVSSDINGVQAAKSQIPRDIPGQTVSVQTHLQVALCMKGAAHVVVVNSSIHSNRISAAMAQGDAHFVLNGSRVTNNTAENFPAGVFAVGNAQVVITGHSRVDKNTRMWPPWLGEGLLAPTRKIAASIWQRLSGGSLPHEAGGGLGVFDKAVMNVSGGSIVAENKCTGCNGGGAALAELGQLFVLGGSSIVGNLAHRAEGGGVHATGSASLVVQGSNISRNRADQGGGVSAYSNSHVTISHGSMLDSNNASKTTEFLASDNAHVVLDGAAVVRNVTSLRGRTSRYALLVQGNAALNLSNVALDSVQGDPSNMIVTMGTASLHVGLGVSFQGRPITRCNGSVIQLGHSSCDAGEYPTQVLSGSVCKCCLPYTYGFNATCEQCPPHAICPGGDVVWPVAGYWHSAPKSVQMHKCPFANRSCGELGVCREGYTGNLCGACVEGFGSTLPFRCNQCASLRQQVTVYLLMFMGSVTLISITVHSTWQDNLAGDTNLRPSDLIKVLVQFLQYLVIFGSISVPWPPFLGYWFQAAALVFSAASGQSSLDCLLRAFVRVRAPLAIQRQLVSLVIAPLAVLLAVVVVIILSYCVTLVKQVVVSNRRHNQGVVQPYQLFSRLRVAVLVVAFYAYPTVVKAALSFFACLPIDRAEKQPYPEYATKTHPHGYWVSDIQQECFAGWHEQWALGLGLPASTTLCLGVPLVLWCFLWANTNRTADPAFRKHYGFLYRNYSNSTMWWEAVWAAQTVLLTGVSVFHLTLKAYYSLLIMAFILLGFAALQQVACPYMHQRLHRLHLASSCCLYISVWLALTLFTFEVDESSVTPMHTAVGAVMVVVNVTFVAWCVYMILRVAHSTVAKTVMAAVDWANAWVFSKALRCLSASNQSTPPLPPAAATAPWPSSASSLAGQGRAVRPGSRGKASAASRLQWGE